MKQLSMFFIVSSHLFLLLASHSAFAEEIPSAQLVQNRKPAVLPRVYIEAESAERGALGEVTPADGVDFYYYDYNDQKPQGEQSPPLRLSRF